MTGAACDAEVDVLDGPGLEELRDDGLHGVDRDRQPHAGHDGAGPGADADDLAEGVDDRPTGAGVVDGGVRLDRVASGRRVGGVDAVLDAADDADGRGAVEVARSCR